MRNRRLLSFSTLAVVALVGVAFLAGCGSSGSGGGSSAAATPTTPATSGSSLTASVAIQNLAYTPHVLKVKVGTTVTWTNLDPTPHDVTSASGPSLKATATGTFASGSMNQGQKFSFTFTKPGTYYYECMIHKTLSAMHAEVVVK